MYYDECVVNGVLSWRGDPQGPWIPMTAEDLTKRLALVEKNVLTLRTINHNLKNCLDEVSSILHQDTEENEEYGDR